MNKVFLIGRLTQDPEVRLQTNHHTGCEFQTAVRWPERLKEWTPDDFFPIVAWGRLAEVVRDYCNKGRQVAVAGRLQNRSWEGQDGNTHYVTEVVAEEIELLGQPSTQEARQQPQKVKQTEQSANPEGFTEINHEEFPFEIDEDLPF